MEIPQIKGDMTISANKIMICIGVILIPFYKIVISLFPYADVLVADTRVGKDFLAVWIALIIGLIAIYNGNVRKSNNVWLFILTGYLLLSAHLGFATPFKMNNVESGGFWMWKPITQSICFFLMYVSVSSLNLKRIELDVLLKIVAYCGLAMSFYVVLQWFDVRQFYLVKTDHYINSITKPHLVGTLGNSTIVAPYIAMIIPITLYLRKYLWSVLMVIVVFLLESQVALGAMVLSIVLYYAIKRPKTLIISALLLGALITFAIRTDYKVETNGRITQWELITEYWKSPAVKGETVPYSITGKGIGSFEYFYHDVLNSHFYKAHNDYLQILCSLGIVGLLIFIAAMAETLKIVNFRMNHNVALFSSLACISICAGGTFVWQLGVYQYMTVLVYGLLCNNSVQRGIV